MPTFTKTTVYDAADIVNEVILHRADGAVATIRDAESIARYGVRNVAVDIDAQRL